MNNVLHKDIKVYNKVTKYELEYELFHSVHPDIAQPSPMWKVAMTLPYMKDNCKCFKAAKVIAYPHFADPPSLCEFCGKQKRDTLILYVIICEHTSD